ncbi:integrase [Salmonella enterica]|nr:integrase [Salmonella enterica]EBM6973074.1 integrase [Salmonella enterica]ECW1489961.1 integrase [Salmonella enterica]
MRKYISDSEWRRFFSAITGSVNELRDKTMLKMTYRHGLRVSELTGLKVTDVDLMGKTIYIRRLKNGFSTVHPLQDETCSLLERWIKKRQQNIMDKDNDWLFISSRGNRLSRQWIYRLCNKYSIKAGFSLIVHPHMLRHACGYALANQGLDTRLIQDYLGHRNINHTVRYTASNPARFIRVWKNV